MTTADPALSGLLRAVLAEPGDDALRLIYADRCDELGDAARGEFVRLQCRIAKLRAVCFCGSCVRLRGGGQHTNGPCAIDQERDEVPGRGSRNAQLRRRERELRERHTADWLLRDIPFAFDVPGLDAFGYRRGFVETLSLPSAAWLAHADDLTAAAPVREVALTDAPEPGHVRKAYLARGWDRHDAYYRIATQPHLQCLRDLWPRITFTLPR